MNNYNLSNSERLNILDSHNNYYNNIFLIENKHIGLDNLILELKNELNFQKNVFIHYSEQVGYDSASIFFTNIQNNYISELFKYNNIIIEKYNVFKNLISESSFNFSEKIDKFNQFILNSVITNATIMLEQYGEEFRNDNESDQVRSAVNKKINDNLQNAINYIKENGITVVFENIRQALFSGVGSIIQTALTFTKAGAIAVEAAWGIMTLYDAYQYFVNKTPGSLTNLIIDIICLLSIGYAGRYLKQFINRAGNSVTSVLNQIMSSNIGQTLKPIITKLLDKSTQLLNWLKQSAGIMKNKMGITWVENLILKVVNFFKDMVAKLNASFTTGLTNITMSTLRSVNYLGNTFKDDVFAAIQREITNKTLSNDIVKYTKDLALDVIDRYVKKYLVNKSTMEALAILDQQFGTQAGDLYAIYYYSKNLDKSTAKGKKFDSKDPLSRIAVSGYPVGLNQSNIQRAVSNLDLN